MSGNARRSSGASRAISGALSPSACRNAAGGTTRAEYSSISMKGTYGGEPSIS
jgi:hypothetical protein